MKEKIKYTILHIDDDESNRYAVKIILEKSGYKVISAETGKEGLLLAHDGPDLIILDIRLPDMSGYEVCRTIKLDPAINTIPVLQTSATFTTSENKVAGLESGADGYLAQPIDNAVLVATVKSLLRIKQAEKLAIDATRSREDMLAIVSHDLRNPLSFLMLQVKMIEKKLVTGDTDYIHAKLKDMTRSCLRMNRLISDLLDVSSIEASKFSVEPKRFPVEDMLNDLKNAFVESSHLAGVEIFIEAAKSNIVLYGDRDRIHQALMNLISNSMKFTPESGRITLGLIEEPARILLTVQDTGHGMAAKDLPHIFDRFWQGNRLKKAGVGLGLSIVKGIVDAHEGEVWVESIEGSGTTFYLSFPNV